MHKKRWIPVIALSLLILLSGCTKANNQTDMGNQNAAKAKIESQLASLSGVSQITWSPDNKKVIFIEAGKTEE